MSSRDDDCTLFVKNLSYDLTKEALEDFFPGCREVRVPTRPDGSIKGFAFVRFSSADEVEDAIKDKQGSELEGRSIYLDYAGSKGSGYGGGGDRGYSGGGGGYGGGGGGGRYNDGY